MKIWFNVVASALVLAGLVWALQGYGLISGSFMTGSSEWLWIGVACVVLGGALLVVGNRRRGWPP